MAIIHTGASIVPFSYSGTEVTRALDAALSSTTEAIKAIYTEATSDKTSSSTEGIRAEGIGNAASGTPSIRGGNFKANMNASKTTGVLEGILAHASVAEGSVTVATHVKGLAAFVSSGASATIANLYGGMIHVQTRGDETVTTDDVLLSLQNEAVGGNGRAMDSWIQLKTTNLSSVNGAGYAVDGGVATDVLNTAVMRFGDDQTICSDDNQAILVDISATANAGFMKVIVGTSTKYIALYNTKTS